MSLWFDPAADIVKNDPPLKPIDPSRPIKRRPVEAVQEAPVGWPYVTPTIWSEALKSVYGYVAPEKRPGMKTCVITVGDYAEAMPHWRFQVIPGGRMSATHPAGAELVFYHSDNPVIGDKAEILGTQVELFCDLAKRFIAGRSA